MNVTVNDKPGLLEMITIILKSNNKINIKSNIYRFIYFLSSFFSSMIEVEEEI